MLMDLIEERHSIRKYTDQQGKLSGQFSLQDRGCFLYDGKYGSAGN